MGAMGVAVESQMAWQFHANDTPAALALAMECQRYMHRLFYHLAVPGGCTDDPIISRCDAPAALLATRACMNLTLPHPSLRSLLPCHFVQRSYSCAAP